MDQLEPQIEGANGGTSPVTRVTGFLAETRLEMDKVSWPSQPELLEATKKVIYGALALGVVIGLFDFLLQKILIDFVASLSQ